MSLTQFVAEYDRQTDLTRDDFVNNSIGKTVDWSGKVIDVSSDYSVTIDIPGTLLSTVDVMNVSPDDAKLLRIDNYIHFTGEISRIVNFFGLHIYVENGKIIK